jgi:RND family efflux transporter MFP subunit
MTSTVAQPGFVEAYEQTAIFSKVSGFIKEFSVDIGDEVKKDQVLCEIFVPELEQQHEQKVAQVELDVSMVKQAQQLVAMAQAHIETATAQQREAEANVGKYRAEVVRWESELRRITKMVAEKAIDKQALDETTNTVASNKSALEAALAAVAARKAATLSAETDLLKAKIDVKTAEAKVKVSEAEERRLAALLDYTKITAPYDGVITVRNANTGDYVETVAGEKTVSGHVPIFVVARTDLVRIFVDVPEQFARYVHTGTKAAIYAEDLSGQEFPATVARTSWSLHEKSRSLRVEIDLPAKKYGLRPAMYVDAKIFLERPKVRAVPQDAVTVLGDQTYAFLLEDGKAVKTPVERGISDGKLTEIVKKKVGGSWLALSGQEEFIVGDLSELVDGQTVSAAAAKGG